ncbi:Low-co2 inducible protein [Seminavis robusta]|uniref:Low-co2 inducible protein n=1 Tax=Seminavis robusta TaxID=568900 RepID=A0A9N8E078_9STRA|nr:Low-co2 inducible protein [Seminavis robusta]|eukprot:Sro520_g159080.1 Low-co2 inducible protein (316) ;mRNA; r:6870-7901
MKFLGALSLLVASASAFSPAAFTPRSSSSSSSALKQAAFTDAEKQVILDKVAKIFEDTPSQEFTPYVGNIEATFPGALDNLSLENKVVSILAEKGFTADNTLLATSLCCDELARRLEDDFVKIYGNNFNLGGLSGFPFAGNTGFGAMAAHIPDDGSCLIIYGPHVGISKSGEVGKVERVGIELVDNCCGSAIAASNYLKGITDGGAVIKTAIQQFTDFQQGAVQELILPHGKRLSDAGDDRMKELPYALYDSQDMLMQDIVKGGAAGGKKNGFAVLGGIQINTAPDTLDYFHPLRFDLVNTDGEVIEDLLPKLSE